MSLPYNLEDSLRIHDVAVFNWLNSLRVDYGTIAGTARNAVPILATAATPDRAFADVPDLLVSRGWIAGATAEEMRTNAAEQAVLPLPLCTMYRTDPVPDPELSGGAKLWRRRFLNPSTGMWEIHQWPGHYRTEYTLTFWSKTKATDVYIREWIYSQLGLPGANQSEVYIPVVHRAPWGTMRQSFRMTGSSDTTDLEGEGQRYVRVDFTFSLRTWIMRKPLVVDAYLLDRIGYASESADRVGVTEANGVLIDGPLGRVDAMSANLFYFPLEDDRIPSQWPVTGAAKVAKGKIGPTGDPSGTLKVTVDDGTDSVELLERLINLDGQGTAIVSIAFKYLSTEAIDLEVTQRSPATSDPTSAFSQRLPAQTRWTRVQVFVLVAGPVFAVNLAGWGGALTDAHVAEIDIRHITTLGLRMPDQRIDAGSDWRYVWSGLANEAVLVITKVVSTPGFATFTVENDDSAPTHTASQSIDSTVNIGMVALTQPRSSTIVATVPKTVALASIILQRYAGHYHGHEL